MNHSCPTFCQLRSVTSFFCQPHIQLDACFMAADALSSLGVAVASMHCFAAAISDILVDQTLC